MLDWDTHRVSQQLRFGSYLSSRQLYELGAMMISDGEPQAKLPRFSTSPNANSIDVNSVSRMNEQSVRQYLNMHLAESNNHKDSSESNISTVVPVSTTSDGGNQVIPSRKQREFINDTYKDEHYWEKRRKNNDAARRSREKRRYHDMVLEGRICDLSKDNMILRNELSAIKRKYNLPLDKPFIDPEESPHSAGSRPLPTSSPGVKYHTSPSMVPSTSHIPNTTHSKGVPYSSPPPLLAVTGSMAVPVQSVYPSNGAQYPYYLNMPGSDSSRANHETNGSNSSIHSSQRNNYSRGYDDVSVKQEEEDDSKSPPPLSIALDSDIRPPVTSHPYDYYQHHQSQGYSSDSWQGSPSNSNSYGSDEMVDQPLQLTVRKDTDTGDTSFEKKESKSPQASSFPLKLRHKLPSQELYSALDSSPSFPPRPYVNGLAQLSEIALAQANPLPLIKKTAIAAPQTMVEFAPTSRRKDRHGNPKYIDPKYIERRRRNNEAARKCRENRKYVTNMREAKSDYLQSENGKLKDELDVLQEEMKQLRELMEKKRLEKGLTEQQMNEEMAEKLPVREQLSERVPFHESSKAEAAFHARMTERVPYHEDEYEEDIPYDDLSEDDDFNDVEVKKEELREETHQNS